MSGATGLDNILSTVALVTSCADGFFLSSTTKTCTACDTNGLTCTDLETNKGHTSCKPGYVIALGKCVAC